jgi:hypothetical protein
LWNGFCGNLIRRANRNTLIAALLMLAIVAALAYFNAKYLSSFFTKAHTIAPAALPTADPNKLIDTFASMPVQHAVETGIQHITTDDAHPNGQVDSEYLATSAGGKVLIVRARQPISDASPDAKPGTLAAATYEGRFVPMSNELQSKVTSALSGYSNLPPILPVYLDTVDYRANGYVLLVFGIPLLLLGLWLFWRFLQFSGDYARHPFAKKLARYGQLEMLVQELDSETAGAHTEYGRMGRNVVITPRWLICKSNWGGVPIRLDHLAWTYRHVMKRKLYFLITIAKWHSLMAYDSFGNKAQVRLKEQQVTDALKELASRAPQIIIGYDQRIQRLWKNSGKDKSNFLTEAKNLISPQDALPEQKTSTMWGV